MRAVVSLVIVASACAQPTPVRRSNSPTDAAVLEVVVARRGCEGSCPIYTLTLRRQGDATYVGRTGPRQGIYGAKLSSIGDFEELTNAISDFHFFDLPDTTGEGTEDAEVVIVTVKTPSKTKVVKTFYFAKAPSEFRNVVTLADRLAANLSWENLNQPKDGIVAPFPLREVEPRYTPEARKARLEGSVILQVEVRPNGTVAPNSISVVQGLGMGLDEMAIEAVTQWVFKPAYKDGKPTGTQMQTYVQVDFRL